MVCVARTVISVASGSATVFRLYRIVLVVHNSKSKNPVRLGDVDGDDEDGTNEEAAAASKEGNSKQLEFICTVKFAPIFSNSYIFFTIFPINFE